MISHQQNFNIVNKQKTFIFFQRNRMKLRYFGGKVLLSLLFVISSTTYAAWEQCNGPSGLIIKALAISGETMFAGSDAGLFLSTNNGENWSRITFVNGVAYWPSICAIATRGDTVFAGSDGSGVRISTDKGTTWSQINTGLTNFKVQCLIVNGNNIFAGTNGGGVFVLSSDRSSWSNASTGLTDMNVQCFTIASNKLLAGTNDGGVFITANNGNSWTNLGSGANGLYNTNIRSLAAIGTNLFAGTYGAGIFKSTDNGINWNIEPSGSSVIDALFSTDSTLYIGGRDALLTSQDTLRTLDGYSMSASNRDVLSFAMLNGKMFAGTSDGIRILTNNTSEQILCNKGLSSTRLSGFAKSGSNIYASGNEKGVFISKDSGVSWTNVNYGIRYNVSSVAVKDSFAIATTSMNLYRSTNQCAGWDASDSGLGYNTNTVSSVVYQNTFYAGTAYGGVYKSINNGETWSPVNFGRGTDAYVKLLQANDTHLFSVNSSGGIFILNGTDSIWQRPSNELSDKEIRNMEVSNRIAIASTSDSGLYQSPDNGETWSACTSGIGKKYAISLAISDNYIFGSFTDSCIYVSPINNIHWTKISTNNINMPGAMLTVFGGYLFAGSFDNGLWRIPLTDLTGPTGTLRPHYINQDLRTDVFKSHNSKYTGTFKFSIPHANYVTVNVFNMNGKEITTFANRFFQSGEHQISWNTHGVANGIYVARMFYEGKSYRTTLNESR